MSAGEQFNTDFDDFEEDTNLGHQYSLDIVTWLEADANTGPDAVLPDTMLNTTLAYDAYDPYALQVVFRGPDGKDTAWRLGRELVVEGLAGKNHDDNLLYGDAFLSNNFTDIFLETHIHLFLRNAADSQDWSRIKVPREPLQDFISRTYDTVPAGYEPLFISTEAGLARILLKEDGAEER